MGQLADSEWTVLLALPDKFRNPPFFTTMHEDLGLVKWERGQITVVGQRQHHFSGVTGVSLARRSFPWLVLVVSNALVLGLISGGFYTTLTPSNPVTWAVLAAINLLLIWSTVSTKWIRISYRNDSAPEQCVYLLPVTSSGARRFDRASERLFALLEKDVVKTPAG